MLKFNENDSIDGYTLLIACVSVGNTAQMCADLFISSLKMKKIGSFWHPACIPIVGTNPYGHDYHESSNKSKSFLNSLSTSLEVFCEHKKKVAVIQMRSSIAKNMKQEFINELIDFVGSKKFSKIIILTSCYSHRLTHLCDSVYNGTLSLNYVVSSHIVDQYGPELKSKNWTLHDIEEENGQLINNIPGCAKVLYEKCLERNFPVLLIFKYCTEGDNREDAIKTTKILDDWINILDKENDQPLLTIPQSWNYFYGNVAPVNIF